MNESDKAPAPRRMKQPRKDALREMLRDSNRKIAELSACVLYREELLAQAGARVKRVAVGGLVLGAVLGLVAGVLL